MGFQLKHNSFPSCHDTNVLLSLTLVQDEGHVALGDLVALLSQQQVLHQRGVRLSLLKAAVGRHETLRPAAALTHVLEELQQRYTHVV